MSGVKKTPILLMLTFLRNGELSVSLKELWLQDICLSTIPKLLEHRPTVFKARLGAALVDRRGRIVCVGFNNKRTHPRAASWHAKGGRPYCTTLHAEMDCLLRAERESLCIPDLTLVVSRTRKKGPRLGFETCLALPCAGCTHAIVDLKVKRVVFSVDEMKTGELHL